MSVAFCLAAPVGAVVIDRILATVDRQVITLSDLRAARDLGLVTAPDDAAAIDRLVERALVLAEVARYAPAEPTPAEIEEALGAMRARLGAEAYEAALRRGGLDAARVRVLVRQELLIAKYLDQRFSVTAIPTDEQVEEYYLRRRGELTGPGGAPLDQEAALALARARLTRERRQRLIDDWIGDLRRRAEISVRSLSP